MTQRIYTAEEAKQVSDKWTLSGPLQYMMKIIEFHMNRGEGSLKYYGNMSDNIRSKLYELGYTAILSTTDQFKGQYANIVTWDPNKIKL